MATFGSDLWALGCIIAEWLTGKPLFKETDIWAANDKIMNWEFELPEDIDPDAKDLIQKLLAKNPYERLGGNKGSKKYGFSALKKHKFFQKKNFENITLESPPFTIRELEILKIHKENSVPFINLDKLIE